MNSIVLLTRLQLMQTIGGIRAALEKRTGSNGVIAGTVVIGVMALAGLGWLGYTAFGILGGTEMSKGVFDTLFLGVGAFTFMFSVPTILGTFFGASDTNDLLALPVTSLAIVLSKALSALAASYLWTMLFIAGPLAGWGIAAGAGPSYWIAYLASVLFAPLMPTAYSGIISILIASAFKRVRRKDAITTITTIITLVGSLAIFLLSQRFSSSSGELSAAFQQLALTLGGIVMAFPAYGYAVYALQNTDPLGIMLFILISVASFALFVVIARTLYIRVITSLSSGGGNAQAYDGTQAQEATPILKSMVRVEVHKVMRNSSIFLNYVVYPAVVTPGLFAFMFFSGSVSKLSEVLPMVVEHYSGAFIAFILLFIVLDTCGNKIATTAISREGSNWTHMKFLPIPYETQVRAKMLPGFFLSAIISVFFVGVMGFLLVTQGGMNIMLVACCLVMALAINWLMACVGIWNDSRKPNLDWGNDGDVVANAVGGGGGELRTFLVGFLFMLLPIITLFVKVDVAILMPVIALASGGLALLLGNRLLAIAARNLQSLE